MSEENNFEKEESSSQAQPKESLHADKPSKRAVEMVDEIRAHLPPLKLKDKSWSNVSFVIILAYMVGLAVWEIYGSGYQAIQNSSGARIGFLLVPILVGNLLAISAWFLGKVLVGKMTGYELTFLTLSGLCYEKHREVKNKNGKVKKFYFNSSYILEMHANFAPKDRKVDANPSGMLWGGMGGIIVMVALLFALYFVIPDSVQWLKWGFLFCGIHAIETLIYQLFPFRQDYPNDMFVFIKTRKEEDRKAYNIYCIDTAYEFADVDLIAPDFNFNPTSYWKSKALIYKYIDSLYKGDLDNCYTILKQCHQISRFLTIEEQAYIAGERLFILLLLNDRAGADMLFTGLKRDVKNAVLKPYRLSTYRNSLLVKGLILNREDDSIDVANKYYNFEMGSNSVRFRQEKRYFETAKSAVLKAHPKFKLPQAKSNSAKAE